MHRTSVPLQIAPTPVPADFETQKGVIQALVQYGARVNEPNDYLWTPLVYATGLIVYT